MLAIAVRADRRAVARAAATPASLTIVAPLARPRHAAGAGGVAIVWLPVLIAGEVLAPRRWFDPRRWSTVFPVVMYAAMSSAVGITAFARAWTWVAVAVWAVVAVGSIRVPARDRTRRWRPSGAADRMAR